jgi:hypothetical protein
MAVSSAAWLLSLHVLAAFAVGAPLTALLIASVALRATDPAHGRALAGIMRISSTMFRAGVAATLVFGLWLVFTRDAYSLLDGWVIAALVLWLAIGGFGDSAVSQLRQMTARDDPVAAATPRRVLWLEAGAAAATLAEFAVMIWRPGA